MVKRHIVIQIQNTLAILTEHTDYQNILEIG